MHYTRTKKSCLERPASSRKLTACVFCIACHRFQRRGLLRPDTPAHTTKLEFPMLSMNPIRQYLFPPSFSTRKQASSGLAALSAAIVTKDLAYISPIDDDSLAQSSRSSCKKHKLPIQRYFTPSSRVNMIVSFEMSLEMTRTVSHALAWSGVNALAALIYIPLNLRHARAWDTNLMLLKSAL